MFWKKGLPTKPGWYWTEDLRGERLISRIEQSERLGLLFCDGRLPNSLKRQVKVFISDPDPNVPLADSILYQSEPFVTDKTDSEIWLTLDEYSTQTVAQLLKKHNEKRVKMRDKEASRLKGKDIFLAPIRIRDLNLKIIKISNL